MAMTQYRVSVCNISNQDATNIQVQITNMYVCIQYTDTHSACPVTTNLPAGHFICLSRGVVRKQRHCSDECASNGKQFCGRPVPSCQRTMRLVFSKLRAARTSNRFRHNVSPTTSIQPCFSFALSCSFALLQNIFGVTSECVRESVGVERFALEKDLYQGRVIEFVERYIKL